MAGQLEYIVCDAADVDQQTAQCQHVQYVQAPLLIPPLDAAGGGAIAVAILGVWALAYVYKSL